MKLKRPGAKQKDGVFIFDEPVKVRLKESGQVTMAVGYNPKCACGPCVYVDPWPVSDDSRGYAVRSSALEEV
jgi:hypothetical protein